MPGAFRPVSFSVCILAAVGAATAQTKGKIAGGGPARLMKRLKEPVRKGLSHGMRWLHDRQREDGSFDGLVAETGMALLTWTAGGSTHKSGAKQKEAAKALAWLREHQWKDGRFWQAAEKGPCVRPFAQAVATLALVECAALARDEDVLEAAGRAVRGLETWLREDGTVADDYQKKGAADFRATAWTLWARFAAREMKVKLGDVDPELTRKWLVANAPGSKELGPFGARPDDGKKGRRRFPGPPSPTARAGMALFLTCYAGIDPRTEPWGRDLLAALGAQKAAKRTTPDDDAEGLMFASHAVYQCGGPDFVAWRNAHLFPGGAAIAKRKGDRQTTVEMALRVQSIQVFWRYGPLFKRKRNAKPGKK